MIVGFWEEKVDCGRNTAEKKERGPMKNQLLDQFFYHTMYFSQLNSRLKVFLVKKLNFVCKICQNMRSDTDSADL